MFNTEALPDKGSGVTAAFSKDRQKSGFRFQGFMFGMQPFYLVTLRYKRF